MNASPPIYAGRPLQPLLVAATYGAAAALWMLFSDRLTAVLAASPQHFTALQTYKGWAFVALTTLLLLLLLRHARRGADALNASIERQAQQYRSLFESNPNPLWIYDLDTLAFLAVNDAAVARYGYSREEFLHMTIADIRPPEDLPRLLSNVAAVSSGLDRAGLWRHLRKDGTPIDVEITSSTLSFDGHRAEMVLAHDVTQELAAQRRVAAAEERLRLALTAARQGLYDLNVQTGEAQINDVYAEMLGYAAGELVETNAAWLERLHPDDRERVGRIYAEYIAGRLPEYRVEFRQRTRQGDWKWILSLGRLMERDAAGAPLRMLGTHTDIDAEKEAQARIERLSSLYAALSECNQAIVRTRERGALLQQVCRVAVDHGGLRMVWIGEVRGEQITPVASYGSRTDYAELVASNPAEALSSGRGPTAVALREDRPVISDDIENDPAMAPWRSRSPECGFRACAAFPLHCGDRTCGVLNLYAAEPHFFDSELLSLVEKMADDISFALDRFRVEAEHAATEQALQESRALLEQAQRVARLGSWRYDARSGTQQWTDEVYRLFGLEPGSITPDFEQFVALVDAADRPRLRALAQSVLAGQPADSIDYGVTVADGTRRILHADLTASRDKGGRATGLFGTVQDVTERRQAEQALRESEARLRRVVEEMPVLFDAFDEQGNILHWNRECERVTGYSAAEVVGNPAAMELLYPDASYREHMLAQWQARGNVYRNWEWTLTAKDGGTRRIAWSNISQVVPIPGWPVWGVGVDVTARRAAEAALSEYTERLQSLSRRLLSVQEEERRALARELHDEIGQQLAALKLNLTVLLRSSPTAPDPRRLADCVEIADLTIERVRDTALNLRPSVLDDLGLTSALHWYARRQAQRAGCRIEVSATLPALPGDMETAVFRIVQEAVNNALRHGKAQRIDIALTMADGAVRLRIADDGAGFDATARARSGMGLLGMRERAELLGGRFELDSTVGGGTQIRADIPLESAAP